MLLSDYNLIDLNPFLCTTEFPSFTYTTGLHTVSLFVCISAYTSRPRRVPNRVIRLAPAILQQETSSGVIFGS